MIQYVHYKYSVGRLFRNRSKTAKFYAQHLKKMRGENASRDDIHNLYNEERLELDIIDYEIERLTTEYFINVARTKFIEVPHWDDETSWVDSSLDPSRKVLSNKAISDLRSKIINYRKERNEQLVPLIAAVTGLTGAIIGIVALFVSK